MVTPFTLLFSKLIRKIQKHTLIREGLWFVHFHSTSRSYFNTIGTMTLLKRKFSIYWFAIDTHTGRFGVRQSQTNKKAGPYERVTYIPVSVRADVRNWQESVRSEASLSQVRNSHARGKNAPVNANKSETKYSRANAGEQQSGIQSRHSVPIATPSTISLPNLYRAHIPRSRGDRSPRYTPNAPSACPKRSILKKR